MDDTPPPTSAKIKSRMSAGAIYVPPPARKIDPNKPMPQLKTIDRDKFLTPGKGSIKACDDSNLLFCKDPSKVKPKGTLENSKSGNGKKKRHRSKKKIPGKELLPTTQPNLPDDTLVKRTSLDVVTSNHVEEKSSIPSSPNQGLTERCSVEDKGCDPGVCESKRISHLSLSLSALENYKEKWNSLETSNSCGKRLKRTLSADSWHNCYETTKQSLPSSDVLSLLNYSCNSVSFDDNCKSPTSKDPQENPNLAAPSNSDTTSPLVNTDPSPPFNAKDSGCETEYELRTPPEDDWEALCVDPDSAFGKNAVQEIREKVGKINLVHAKSDYRPYQSSEERELCGESVIEIYGFSPDLKTQDLMMVFAPFVSRGFQLKWVDDTHALGVFPSVFLGEWKFF